MKPVSNNIHPPFDKGDKVKIPYGRWQGVREVLYLTPCLGNKSETCNCEMGRRWMVLSKLPSDIWDDPWNPAGITFCYKSLFTCDAERVI